VPDPAGQEPEIMTLWQRLADFVSATPLTGALFGGGTPGDVAEGGDAPRPEADVRFTMALIALLAKMARSDGVVTGDEVEAFRRIVQVPEEEEGNVRRVFDLAKRDVAGFQEYTRQIARMFEGNKQQSLDVLEALFVIAAADGILHELEDDFLATVASLLELAPSELGYIRSLFVKGGDNAYIVLGLTPSASDAEIKARHRSLAIENHPDRLMGRGVPAEFVTIAERKLAAINAAFDSIARERGL
jgi:DnaJ like chaperone protein